MEDDFTFYPKCWDCFYYSSGNPEARELESCKNKMWYTKDGNITGEGLIAMMEQMENSELCPYFVYGR